MFKTIGLMFLFFVSSSATLAQWNQISLDPPSTIYSLFTSENKIYAGGDSILYHSTDDDTVWLRSSRIDDVEYGITSIEKWNNKLFAGTIGKGVFESLDEGSTWQALNNGLTGTDALDISSMIVRGDSLYAGTAGEGVFVLNLLNPDSWVAFRDGLPSDLAWNIYSLYNFDGQLICGAGQNAKVYMNEVGTTYWIEHSFDIFSGESNALLDITSCNDVIIGCANLGIYRSLNNGISWEHYDPGIGFINEASLIVVDYVTFAVISKSATSFLLSSINCGNDWQFEFELNSKNFALSFFNNRLFTGRVNGLFYLPYRPSSVNDEKYIPSSLILHQNYPNPFNLSTIISWQSSIDSWQSLKVFNVLGNTIKVLIDEYKNAGIYKTSFCAEGLSSGIYFYRLQSESSVTTKKMVLIR